MEHIMACCVECKCGQRIKTKYWEEHMASCDAMSEDYSRKQRSENSTKRIASFVDVHSDKSIRRL